ncbi:MAG: 4'-phosphopantetheinyl transferase superfamily protein [Bacteroidota bacterium]
MGHSGWRTPPARPALPEAEIHVWRVSLAPEAREVDRLGAWLAPDERARAARFRFDRHRRRYVVARGRLREILGRYLGAPPEALAFQYGDHGKPALAEAASGLTFNVSHTADHALVAVARGRRLGVDLEVVRPLPDADAIAERFFSASEVAAYRAVPETGRPAAFFACWTRKEAFVKAVGDGLTYGLSTFDAAVAPEAETPLLRVRSADARAAGWDAADVPLGPGLAAAVAADRPGWRWVGWHDPAHEPGADRAPGVLLSPSC